MRFSVSKVGQADIPRPYTEEYLISNIALQPTWCSNLDMDEMQLETPVQGTVWKVVAKVGQTVQVGETVLIIESMKMEERPSRNLRRFGFSVLDPDPDP